MLPIIQVGPLALQVPGLIIIAGIWLGLTLAERAAPRHGIAKNTLDNLIMLGLLAGIIGARLSYVLRYTDIFIASPLNIISINPGLLDPFGGLAAALIVVMIFAQRKELEFWPTLDALTPFFAVMAVAIGVSHITSGAAFGSESDLPWAIELWGASRHPTQIYETLAALVILAIVWPDQRWWRNLPPGVYALSFVALSAAVRLFLEAFRADSVLILDGFRSAQIVAWIVLALCLWGIWRLRSQPKQSEQVQDE